MGGHSGSSTSAAGRSAAGQGGTGCAPVPCPSNAPWNAATCSCRATSGDECMVDSDCALVTKGCCSCPPATADSVVPTTRARMNQVQAQQCPAGPVACGPCQVVAYDPLAPILHAGCVAHHCAAVDLRSADFSKCSKDSECRPIPLGCCGANSNSPDQYAGFRDDSDAGILECVPVPPCVPPTMHAEPASFCAPDGHCAVRSRNLVAGLESTTCYSPSQNIDHAYDAAANGCDCSPGTASVCRTDSTGRNVALICQESGHWQSANDGPCGKKP
jgi:hypothetical protein